MGGGRPTFLPSANPPGWRPEDFGAHDDGFVSVEEAAEQMGVTVAEVEDAVGRWLLEADEHGRVRPAVVSYSGPPLAQSVSRKAGCALASALRQSTPRHR